MTKKSNSKTVIKRLKRISKTKEEFNQNLLIDMTISKLKREGFNDKQVRQVIYGIKDNIDYNCYYDKRYNDMQMSVIREFLKKGVNVYSVLNPEIPNDEMFKILNKC